MDSMKNKIFNLFANCKLVKGVKRATICDLQRGKLFPIPLSLYSILKLAGTATWNQMIETFKIEDNETLEEYFQFLVGEDLIFFNDKPDLFPSISDDWDEPYELTNCILDFNSIDEEKVEWIRASIGDLPIKALQFRIFTPVLSGELRLLFDRIKPKGLSSIEVIMRFSDDVEEEQLTQICEENPYIFTISVFGAPYEKYMNNGYSQFGQIFFLKEEVHSEKCCGKISSDFFTINMKTYTESKKYNSCLNRKISIDIHGNIKNCPSMNESFGHISNTTFNEVLSNALFSKFWNIHKDLIHTCKDCEFRYICTDCRAYIEDPTDVLSKPLKCGYDPYSCTWHDWTSDDSKKKLFAYYSLTESLEVVN